MQLYVIRVASLIVVALVYMLFDLFNKRNVPATFAYGTLIYGFILTILYFNVATILESVAISLIVLGIGYIFYKIGQLGAADVVEFAALSLIMPILAFPLLATSALQLQLPFIISLAINTGIVAIIIVPIYYIPKAASKLKKPIASYVEGKNIFIAVFMALIYIAFIAFTILVLNINYIGIIVLSLMTVSSFFVMLFSVPITYSMVEYVTPDKFDEGDIIAVSLMSSKEIADIKKKVKSFDRLLTSRLIGEIKKNGIKKKLPVYKKAMPFALPIFIAVILTLLVGNLILLILSI